MRRRLRRKRLEKEQRSIYYLKAHQTTTPTISLQQSLNWAEKVSLDTLKMKLSHMGLSYSCWIA